VTESFAPISLPLAARAALWAGDAPAAGAVVSQIERSVSRGQAITLDHQTLGAGVAALAGLTAKVPETPPNTRVAGQVEIEA
jgi:hypothetical protein